ncbi:DUF1080 domain-containing protein [bacterium]|nr:DUF1080 domain-containing protein [bacterium]
MRESATLAGGVLVAALLAACAPAADAPPTPSSAPAAPAAAAGAPSGAMTPNTLSAAELAEGWTLLFNGQTLDGWRSYKADAPPAQWVIEDGALSLSSGGGGDIMTAAEYGPFDLKLEWKISPGGNSGVIYLVKTLETAPNTYNTGPEMQVLDDERHRDGAIPSHRAGALYDLVIPSQAAARPVGEWNEARIVFTGSRLEHWLNGVKIVETSYGDADWAAKVEGSKFRTMPDFGKASSGHIALQDHGDRVWYRNIKLKPL